MEDKDIKTQVYKNMTDQDQTYQDINDDNTTSPKPKWQPYGIPTALIAGYIIALLIPQAGETLSVSDPMSLVWMVLTGLAIVGFSTSIFKPRTVLFAVFNVLVILFSAYVFFIFLLLLPLASDSFMTSTSIVVFIIFLVCTAWGCFTEVKAISELNDKTTDKFGWKTVVFTSMVIAVLVAIIVSSIAFSKHQNIEDTQLMKSTIAEEYLSDFGGDRGFLEASSVLSVSDYERKVVKLVYTSPDTGVVWDVEFWEKEDVLSGSYAIAEPRIESWEDLFSTAYFIRDDNAPYSSIDALVSEYITPNVLDNWTQEKIDAQVQFYEQYQ